MANSTSRAGANVKAGMAAVLLLAYCCCAAVGDVPAPSCSAIMTGLRVQCAQYVMGSAPPRPTRGSGCCQVIQSPALPCVCNNIPSGVLGLLNRPAILAAISSCGVKLRHGTRCAGMTYPGGN